MVGSKVYGCAPVFVAVPILLVIIAANFGDIARFIGITLAIGLGLVLLVSVLGLGLPPTFSSGSNGASQSSWPPRYEVGDGRAFEQYVKHRLAARGYHVRETPPSGDFGVDLLANHYGHNVAIQVKNHERPVGVQAVQEVHAGMRYYNADAAWVVSRSGFTPQAKRLAKATGVRLVEDHQL